MNLITSIANLYSSDMLRAVLVHAGAFWMAHCLLTAAMVALWTADAPKARIWK